MQMQTSSSLSTCFNGSGITQCTSKIHMVASCLHAYKNNKQREIMSNNSPSKKYNGKTTCFMFYQRLIKIQESWGKFNSNKAFT